MVLLHNLLTSPYKATQIRNSRSKNLPVEKEEKPISIPWARKFLRQRENLDFKPVKRLERKRIEASDPTIVNQFFDTLTDFFDRYHYHPNLIANYDETHLSPGTNIKKQVTLPNKSAVVPIPPKGYHVTLGVLIFADGSHGEPLVIIPGKKLPPDIEGYLHDASVSTSANGWITREIFQDYIQKVVIEEFRKRRTILGDRNAHCLLFVDPHNSRESVDALNSLRSNNIDTIALPSHLSHLIQPLDQRVFPVFKQKFRANFNTPRKSTRATLRVAIFKALGSSLWDALNPIYVRESFELTGLFPLNREKILRSKLMPEEKCQKPIIDAPKKRKRKSRWVPISGQILTSTEIINELKKREEKPIIKRHKTKH